MAKIVYLKVEGEIIHNQSGFQELMNEIQTLPDDLMFVFESTGISKFLETFCQKTALTVGR
ncbi:hypothetical protein SAMN04488072_1101 [Lentibacillus halodurans]|uniref:Uncharacterized protein n=1 Tax=Lentibacillus halodurans TaxID=237679 RepID=A0A1I0Z820_9BACI|nr:hypothetical protein [Lentibacillus halodurans]SFB21246.1 hypothetical protein SAMN04488072_1101 [Lentibacillus halodurans]